MAETFMAAGEVAATPTIEGDILSLATLKGLGSPMVTPAQGREA
jgi:hypothetical protein